MFKTFQDIFKINRTYGTNAFLYKLRRLFIVNKIIPENIYAYTEVKVSLSVLLEICSIIGSFLLKFIFIGLAVYLPVKSLDLINNPALGFVTIFVGLNLIIGSFLMDHFLNPNLKKYRCVILMGMDAKKYAISDFYVYLVKLFITFLPALLVFGSMCQVPIWLLILLDVVLVATRIIGAKVSLNYYKKNNDIFVNKTVLAGTLIGVFALLTIAAPVIGIYIPIHFLLIIPAIALIIWSISCWKKLKEEQTYPLIYRHLVTPSNVIINISDTQKKAEVNSVQISNDDLVVSESVHKKKGFEYFNAIFFERHKRILMKQVRICTMIMLCLLIASIAIPYLFPEAKSVMNKFIMTSLPYFVFIMYILNRGQVLCKAMFFNCDHSMLAYQFYHTSKNLLRNFRVRFRLITKLNLIPAVTLALGLDILLWVTGGTSNPFIYVSLFLSIIFMSIFFSIHNLVLYYLLQPYDINMNSKSSGYDILNLFTYWVCYMCLKISIDTFLFSLGTILFTIVYVIIAILLIYKLAPKTFKLK